MLLIESLTAIQILVLVAVVRLCSEAGEVRDHEVAASAGLDTRTTVLSLRALATRGLVRCDRADGERWVQPTFAGRDCARALERARMPE